MPGTSRIQQIKILLNSKEQHGSLRAEDGTSELQIQSFSIIMSIIYTYYEHKNLLSTRNIYTNFFRNETKEQKNKRPQWKLI